MPFHAPSSRRDWIQPAGSRGRARLAEAGEDVAETVRERLADGEDDFKYADDDDKKEQRPPDAMEQDVVDFARAFDGERGAVTGAAADLGGPGVGAGGVADYGEGKGLGGFALGLLVEEERDGIDAGAVDGADLGDGGAEFAGELEGIDFAAAGFHEVAHVEQDQGGQAEGEDRARQA